jgi:hypothetical protein
LTLFHKCKEKCGKSRKLKTKKISSYLRHLLSEHLEPIGDLLELILHLLVGDKVSHLLADGAAWRK